MPQAVRFSSGRNAKFACPRCGQVYPYTSKRYEAYTQTWVCPSCLDELPVDRQPIPRVVDAESLRNPRNPNEQDITAARPLGASFTIWPGAVEAVGELGLIGVQINLSTGTLAVSGAGVASLTGAAATFSAGSPAVTVAVALTGAEIAFAAGTVTAYGAPGWGQGTWGSGSWSE